MKPINWGMLMLISAGATVLFPMLLVMTGLAVFTWLGVIALVMFIITAVGMWVSRF